MSRNLCTKQVGSEKVSWAEQICSCLWQRISVAEDICIMYLYIWQSTFYVTYDRAGWKWAGELGRAGACDCVQGAKESCHLSTPPSPPALRSSSFSRWSCSYKITSKDDHTTWSCHLSRNPLSPQSKLIIPLHDYLHLKLLDPRVIGPCSIDSQRE